MSDAHDLHVLNDLIAALRATEGAPSQAVEELEAQTRRLGHGGDEPASGVSVIDAARDALGGLLGGAHAGLDTTAPTQRLASLMARMQAAMDDERLSGPARDAVIRAFDPVKEARDAALQADLQA